MGGGYVLLESCAGDHRSLAAMRLFSGCQMTKKDRQRLNANLDP